MQSKEEEKEYQKQYHIDNKEHIKEHQKQYHIDNKEHIKKYQKQYRIDNRKKYKEYCMYNKEKRRNSHIKRLYNITPEQYNELFNVQEGRCPICGKHQDDFKRPFGVDHDHKTESIRGLLCDKCNLLLGYAKDDIILLQKAIDYLNNYNE
jgi:hypothetical protein